MQTKSSPQVQKFSGPPKRPASAQPKGERRNTQYRTKQTVAASSFAEVSNNHLDGSLMDKMRLPELHLQSFMLWHASNIPSPRSAIVNIPNFGMTASHALKARQTCNVGKDADAAARTKAMNNFGFQWRAKHPKTRVSPAVLQTGVQHLREEARQISEICVTLQDEEGPNHRGPTFNAPRLKDLAGQHSDPTYDRSPGCTTARRPTLRE